MTRQGVSVVVGSAAAEVGRWTPQLPQRPRPAGSQQAGGGSGGGREGLTEDPCQRPIRSCTDERRSAALVLVSWCRASQLLASRRPCRVHSSLCLLVSSIGQVLLRSMVDALTCGGAKKWGWWRSGGGRGTTRRTTWCVLAEESERLVC